jgi:hypothetical protein
MRSCFLIVLLFVLGCSTSSQSIKTNRKLETKPIGGKMVYVLDGKEYTCVVAADETYTYCSRESFNKLGRNDLYCSDGWTKFLSAEKQ